MSFSPVEWVNSGVHPFQDNFTRFEKILQPGWLAFQTEWFISLHSRWFYHLKTTLDEWRHLKVLSERGPVCAVKKAKWRRKQWRLGLTYFEIKTGRTDYCRCFGQMKHLAETFALFHLLNTTYISEKHIRMQA